MSFAKLSIQSIIVQIFLTVISLGVVIIKARWLGPEGVGTLALLLLIKFFAFQFGNLGFSSAFVFFTAKKKVSTRLILKIAWLLSAVMSTIIGIIFVNIWSYDFSPWKDIQPSLFYLSLLTIPLFFCNTFMSRILSGKLKITVVNIANLLTNIGNIIFLILLVIVFEMGIFGAIISSLLSDLLTSFYLALQFRQGNYEDTKPEELFVNKLTLMSKLWHYGKWNYLLVLFTFLAETLPIIVLKNLIESNVSVGLFTKAQYLGKQSTIVARTIASVLFPYTAVSAEKDATKRTNILCRNYIVFIALAVVLMILFIKPFILVLYGEAFLPAAEIFYAMAPGVFLWPFVLFLGTHVIAIGKPREIFFVSIYSIGVSILACWFLIPIYGAVGAGLSFSIILAARTILQFIVYKKVTGTSFSEVFFPCTADWVYYQRLIKNISLKLYR